MPLRFRADVRSKAMGGCPPAGRVLAGERKRRRFCIAGNILRSLYAGAPAASMRREVQAYLLPRRYCRTGTAAQLDDTAIAASLTVINEKITSHLEQLGFRLPPSFQPTMPAYVRRSHPSHYKNDLVTALRNKGRSLSVSVAARVRFAPLTCSLQMMILRDYCRQWMI